MSHGYKKTSIKELCTGAGIAIGTFYSLFATKEDVFFETAKTIQNRLKEQFLHTVRETSDKNSLAQAMKELYREYDSKPFLYNAGSPDFQAFFTKLPEEAMGQIRPYLQVTWTISVLIAIIMIIAAFLLKKDPARKKSPWILGGIGTLLAVSSGTQLVFSIFMK